MLFSMSAKKRVELCEKKIAYEKSDDKLHIHVHSKILIETCQLIIITRLFNLSSDFKIYMQRCGNGEPTAKHLVYLHHSYPAPHILSSVSIYQTFTRLIGQCPV